MNNATTVNTIKVTLEESEHSSSSDECGVRHTREGDVVIGKKDMERGENGCNWPDNM